MPTKYLSMDIQTFKDLPLIGILRGITSDMIDPIVETSVAAGLKTIEITMNTDGAADLIKKMITSADGRLTVGAGTVLTMDDLRSALDAGATFIILPVLVAEVVEYCAENSIPVFPGAFTPQEIYDSWQAGATMVKVFPSNFFGPNYFMEIKGPFNDIDLLACGGVNPGTIGDFFLNGASAAAFGGSVFKREWLVNKDYANIGTAIETLIAGYKRYAVSP